VKLLKQKEMFSGDNHQYYQMGGDLATPNFDREIKMAANNEQKSDRLAAEFELAEVELPRSFDVVDLGINFNSKLDFSDHISCIIAKAKQRLFLLDCIYIGYYSMFYACLTVS